MAQMTIAQKREKEVRKFAEMAGQEKAANMMNRYYRLCGMDERLLYLENDERTANRRSTADLAARRDAALDRLNKDFSAYGMKLVYFGYLPTIVYIDSTATAINAYYYQH